MAILDKEVVAEKYLDILEVAVAATEFCGYENKGYRTMIKSDEDSKNTWFRVIFNQRYGSDSNEPTYSLSTTIGLNGDNTSIASVCVHEHSGYYDGFIDKMSGDFEGYVDTTDTDTRFSPNANRDLEVNTTITKHKGHTNKGVDYDSTTEKTEVYEFDGNWKNLSPDMKKIGPKTNNKVAK